MTTLSASMKSDRRVRRTRQLLANALFTLMKEKSYNDITVKELCEAADINRGTFYLHYKDIDDMVEQIEQEILTQFEALICAHAPPPRTTLPTGCSWICSGLPKKTATSTPHCSAKTATSPFSGKSRKCRAGV